MRKVINMVIPFIIILVWLMPVSNQYNTLNNGMMIRCYIFSLAILLLVFLYEGRINIYQIMISALILLSLIIFTGITISSKKNIAVVSYGYILNYMSFCVLINVKSIKFRREKILDILFLAVCAILIIVGILTVLDNAFIEDLLKTNYIIHYPHIYTVMWSAHKTVTFFGTHSIACYIYFILWWLLDYRRHIKKGIINYILMVGMLFNILMCTSVSAILCLGIILVYYYFSWIKKASKSSIIKSLIIILFLGIVVLLNINSIVLILFSSENGILGRYGSSGNLNVTLRYMIDNIIPIGICDIDGLWLTDGGYFVHLVRGGPILIALFYCGLYRFLKRNIRDKNRFYLLFFSLLLFEVGYQFTISMRFFMIMLFAILYFSYLFEEKQTLSNRTLREKIQ